MYKTVVKHWYPSVNKLTSLTMLLRYQHLRATSVNSTQKSNRLEKLVVLLISLNMHSTVQSICICAFFNLLSPATQVRVARGHDYRQKLIRLRTQSISVLEKHAVIISCSLVNMLTEYNGWQQIKDGRVLGEIWQLLINVKSSVLKYSYTLMVA